MTLQTVHSNLWRGTGVTPKATVTNTTSQLGTDYAVITGSDVEIKRGDEVQLAVGTNLKR